MGPPDSHLDVLKIGQDVVLPNRYEHAESFESSGENARYLLMARILGVLTPSGPAQSRVFGV